MKIELLTVILFISCFSFGQTDTIQTKINEKGILEGEFIVSFTDKSSVDLYKLSMEWISYTFKNSESVIQSEVEGKMIRISGISTSIIGPLMSFYFDLGYDMQLDFRDNKLRFRAYNLKQIAQSFPYTKTSLEIMFKKSGELKSARRYSKVKTQIDNEVTGLLGSLKDKIEGKAEKETDDW